MTKQQIAGWARAMVTGDDGNRLRVVVKGVSIHGAPAKVRFVHNRNRHVYVARCHGHNPIMIRFDDERSDFVATSNHGEVLCHANTADKAFAHAVNKAWA